MDFPASKAPDLASVLAVLREYAPGPQEPTPNQEQPSSHSEHNHRSTELIQSDAPHDSRPSRVATPLAESNRHIAQSRNSPRPAAIDATTITNWSAGLRHVSKVASQTSWFAESIQKMIREQSHHERQWYIQRQNLKQRLAHRGAGATEAQKVLESLGSAAKIDTPVMTPERQATELKEFDAKIYKAQCDMANVMSAELKALGVPFFGTKASLVVKSPGDGRDNGMANESKNFSLSSQLQMEPGQIEESELIKLQRRMLEYLEDMYKS